MKISILFDIMRWEERAILKSLQDKNVEVQLYNVKEMNLDLQGSNYDFGDISLQRSTGYYRNLHSTAYVEFTGNHIINDFRNFSFENDTNVFGILIPLCDSRSDVNILFPVIIVELKSFIIWLPVNSTYAVEWRFL